jgi:hypothetical protein
LKPTTAIIQSCAASRIADNGVNCVSLASRQKCSFGNPM